MSKPNICRFDLHNRRILLVPCATETTAIRTSDSDVWQSVATGTDQDDLAVAWRTPFLVQAGARLVSPSPARPSAEPPAGVIYPIFYSKPVCTVLDFIRDVAVQFTHFCSFLYLLT